MLTLGAASAPAAQDSTGTPAGGRAEESEQREGERPPEPGGAAEPAEEETVVGTVEEEIVVTGERLSIMTAQEAKLAAPEIVDSVVATDIGKLPDRSVTEAVQRVPGVTITRFKSLGDPEHFSAEGSGVMVRGLTLVRSELNSRNSFTADGGRALSFQDVPPELMQRVDVYKNQSAELIEGGVGGTIDLVTKRPSDYDGARLATVLEGNYGNFVDEVRPSGSVLFSQRWETTAGDVGVLLDVAYSEAATRTDGVYTRAFFPRNDLVPGTTVYVPRGADWRTYAFDRERQGAYAVVDWSPGDSVQMALQVFDSQYQERWDESSIFVDNWPLDIIPAQGTSFQYDGNNRFQSGRLDSSSASGGIPMGIAARFQDRDSHTTDFSYDLNWRPTSRWDLDLDLQYISGSSRSLDSTVAAGVELPYLDVDLTGSRPQMQSDPAHLANPANYYMAFTMDNRTDNDAEQWAGRMDAAYSTELSVLQTVRFGARLTDTESENHDTGFHWQPIYQQWMRWWALDGLAPMPQADPRFLSLFNLNNFYRGSGSHPGLFMAPTLALAGGFPGTHLALHQQAASSGNYLCCFGEITLRDLDADEFTNLQDEKTQAFYLQGDFAFNGLKYPIGGNVGVRVVETEMSTRGFVVYPTTVTDTAGNRGFDRAPEAIGVDNDYTNVLPSLNVRMFLRDNLLLRFAGSRALSRPAFGDLQSYRILGASLPSGVGLEDGPTLDDFVLTADLFDNPRLEPVTADQLDLSLEWYFNRNGGLAHANLFHKEIDGLISRSFTEEVYGGHTYTVTQPTNNGSGSLRGFEVGLKKFFDEWRRPFDGFGLDLTYTYIDSDLALQDVSRPVDTDRSSYGALPFIGISRDAFNLTVLYDHTRFSSRLAYNWRSKFLMGVGQNGFNGDVNGLWRLPVYTDDYGQLDASVQYHVADWISLSLMGINLANAETTLIASQNAAGDHTSSYVNDSTFIFRVSLNR
jgi:TonB-dependent receptor